MKLLIIEDERLLSRRKVEKRRNPRIIYVGLSWNFSKQYNANIFLSPYVSQENKGIAFQLTF